MLTYENLVQEFSKKPRNVRTAPLSNRLPRWFWVTVENNTIIIESGKTEFVNSVIQGKRILKRELFESMFDLYQRRKNGEQVSQEAVKTTYNQVYWYGIFSDLDL
ncbi:MAG: hypothetical protein IJ308_00100 [Clostridia bacterium]|nr:hypothetical protein [Clostridia bacterium]